MSKILYHPGRRKATATSSFGITEFNEQGIAEVEDEVYAHFTSDPYWANAQKEREEENKTHDELHKDKLQKTIVFHPDRKSEAVVSTAFGDFKADKKGKFEVPLYVAEVMLAGGFKTPEQIAEEDARRKADEAALAKADEEAQKDAGKPKALVPTLEEYTKRGYPAETYERRFFGLKPGDPYDEAKIQANIEAAEKAKAEEEAARLKAEEEKKKAEAAGAGENAPPPLTVEALSKMKKAELIEHAKSIGLETVTEKMKNEEIVEAILTKRTQSADAQ